MIQEDSEGRKKERYQEMQNKLREEPEPKKQEKIFDDFMKMKYMERMKIDPLSLRPEHERKCMADIILQHEGEDLII